MSTAYETTVNMTIILLEVHVMRHIWELFVMFGCRTTKARLCDRRTEGLHPYERYYRIYDEHKMHAVRISIEVCLLDVFLLKMFALVRRAA